MIVVNRVEPGDAERLRETRLAALLDAPGSFASTHAEEAGRPRSHWDVLARTRSAGSDHATFLGRDATRAGPFAGMVGGYREPEAAALVHLVAMWVRPDCRGMGLGRRLVTAVTEWAAETDGHRVELWVATGNTAAQNLYAHCGFTEVGSYQPLPSDPCTNETRMRLEV